MHPLITLLGKYSPGRRVDSLYDDRCIQTKIFLTGHDKLNGFHDEIRIINGFQGFRMEDGEHAFFEWRKDDIAK